MAKFEDVARNERRTGSLREVWRFLAHTRKWWLLPIVVTLVLFGVLIALAGGGAAPFLYSLF
jgi:hypothetical protein